MGEKNKLSVYERNEYLHNIKFLLTKENWKVFKRKFSRDDETIYKMMVAYHKLGRNKEKLNEWFEKTFVKRVEPIKSLEQAIELHKKAIEKLERIKYEWFLLSP